MFNQQDSGVDEPRSSAISSSSSLVCFRVEAGGRFRRASKFLAQKMPCSSGQSQPALVSVGRLLARRLACSSRPAALNGRRAVQRFAFARETREAGVFNRPEKKARFQCWCCAAAQVSITVISRNGRTCWKVRTTPHAGDVCWPGNRFQMPLAQRDRTRLSAYKNRSRQLKAPNSFTRANSPGANQRHNFPLTRIPKSDTLLTASKPPAHHQAVNRIIMADSCLLSLSPDHFSASTADVIGGKTLQAPDHHQHTIKPPSIQHAVFVEIAHPARADTTNKNRRRDHRKLCGPFRPTPQSPARGGFGESEKIPS